MCSSITERVAVTGSGKGPNGWFELSHINVTFDHPFFTPANHTLNLDFVNESREPGVRVAVELSADSARELLARLHRVLAEADRLGE